MSLSLNEGLTIFAILAGPAIAVQLTRYLDEAKEIRNRKLLVYKTLMAHRAANLAPAHVESLNRIPLEFNGKGRQEREVMTRWRQYLDHLGNASLEGAQWTDKRVDLLVELLYAMGVCVGYVTDKTELKNGVYAPQYHGRMDAENDAVRSGFAEIFAGKRAFPIELTNVPSQEQK